MEAEESRRVTEVNVKGAGGFWDGFDEGVEEFKLTPRELAVFIGDGKVGSDARQLDSSAGFEFFKSATELVGKEAAAAHSGIEGEVGLHRLIPSQGVEVLHFFNGTKAGRPITGCDLLPLGGQGGSKNVGAGFDAGIEESAGFSGIGHAEEGEACAIEFPGHFHQSVTVSACFDDRHHFFVGTLINHRKIVAKGTEVDFSPGTWRRGGHGMTISRIIHLEIPNSSAMNSVMNNVLSDYEKLGSFHLGKEYDVKTREVTEGLLLYDSKVDINVFTPGSNSGIPVSILSSPDAPPFEVNDDGELFSERIESTVSSLLSLVGVDADPIQSPEAVLLGSVFGHCWSVGQSLSLETLIRHIQKPPFGKVGVIDLESFMDQGDRQKLALRFNSLLASPGFSTWLEGPPLDIQRMMYTKEGKPRISIFSISHLSDTERMFFVSLLLNQMLGWMRAQSGDESQSTALHG